MLDLSLLLIFLARHRDQAWSFLSKVSLSPQQLLSGYMKGRSEPTAAASRSQLLRFHWVFKD